MSNTFFQEGRKFFQGGLLPCALLVTSLHLHKVRYVKNTFAHTPRFGRAALVRARIFAHLE